MYKRCLELATKWHKGQKRRGREDYINHAVRVADMFEDEFMKCVAVLHDVLEDTECTGRTLLHNDVDQSVVRRVVSLTHDKNDPYSEYIKWVSINKQCKQIKIADIVDNLSSNPTERQKVKYFNALCQLSK